MCNVRIVAVFVAAFISIPAVAQKMRPPAAMQSGDAALVTIAIEEAGNAVKRLLNRHPTIHPIAVDGKFVYVIPLKYGGASRATDNFSAPEGGRNMIAYVVNVDPQTRAKVSFQRKGDKRGRKDSNRGKQFAHLHRMRLDGSGNYLAWRNMNGDDVISRFSAPAVLLVEEGLSIDRVNQALGK